MTSMQVPGPEGVDHFSIYLQRDAKGHTLAAYCEKVLRVLQETALAKQ